MHIVVVPGFWRPLAELVREARLHSPLCRGGQIAVGVVMRVLGDLVERHSVTKEGNRREVILHGGGGQVQDSISSR